MVRLETVLDSWKSVREDTIQAVKDFPPAELDFKPTPDVGSFREIARHILDAGHALTGMLLAGEENLAGPHFRERVKQFSTNLPDQADAQALTAELQKSLDARVAELSQQSPEFFAHLITRFDGQRVTRLEMLQFVKEHELTHRAQLFLYSRLKGVVPVTTRRRMAKQAAQ
jgi:uncharacterized damage-inducible protein DinB